MSWHYAVSLSPVAFVWQQIVQAGHFAQRRNVNVEMGVLYC